MPNVELRPSIKLSLWRRMAAAIWGHPSDPTIYARLEVDMAKALEFAEKLGRTRKVRITPTHLVARAVALALRAYPEANAIVRIGGIRQRRRVHLFFHVAVPGEQIDLTGVVVHDADLKGPAEIAQQLQAEAVAARRGEDREFSKARRRLQRTPAWLLRGVLRWLDFFQYSLNLDPRWFGLARDAFGGAMITSVGSLGIPEAFAPLVPLTRAPMVVAVGKVEPKPVVREGTIVIRPVCVLGATLDHRVFDGLLASKAAKFVLRYLADPAKEEGTVM